MSRDEDYHMNELIESIINTAKLDHDNKDMDFSELETIIREEYKEYLDKRGLELINAQ